MGRCVGRPVAAVVLSAKERSFLERQVRRRQVVRGMSDRCRIVLRCADGLTSKAVAAAFPEGSCRGTVGRTAFGPSVEHRGRAGGRGRQADA